MADFKPINTQEEFDAAIQSRLDRERAKFSDYETLKKKAGDYDKLVAQDYEGQLKQTQEQLSKANEAIAGHAQIVSDLTKRAEAAESAQLKAKIAHEYKIPFELSGKLTGTNEEEMRRDAESFAKYVGHTAPAPLASTEPAADDTTQAALRGVLQNLNLNGG